VKTPAKKPFIVPKSSVGTAKGGKLDKKALAKAREAEKRAAIKAREAEKRAREKEAKRVAFEKKQDAERKKRDAERAKLALEQQRKRESEQKAREVEKARVLAAKEAAKEAARQAAEAEKLKKIQEREEARLLKEQEKLQLKAQKEAEREEARRLKEEEKAKRDAEREAYRKAKEAEREKIRAAKEAARHALEVRIAEQSRNANKLGGGRSSSTRFYSPKAIPDQSGTTRRTQGTIAMMGCAPTAAATIVAPTGSEPPTVQATPPVQATPSPTVLAPLEQPQPPLTVPVEEAPVAASTQEGTLPIAAAGTPTADGAASPVSEEEAAAHASAERAHLAAENAEERYRAIEERLKRVPETFRRDYQESIDMSWIHHDSALEGVVYTFQELKAALDPAGTVITDSSLQPVIDEIRRHKSAIDLVRDLGERKRAPITVDTIKKIYVTLHPEEGDIKTVKYRRDIPQHRLYFHEYAHPEKIPQKVRQVVDWLNGPEPKKLKSPIRVAARVHYELLRAFPFQNDSGKVARLVMNLILIRHGHPPALIHSTERQRYYEALKGALPVLVQMVTESILNALSSIEKLLDEHDAKLRA
jgi:chemotaxis protein histidine kinase CheA